MAVQEALMTGLLITLALAIAPLPDQLAVAGGYTVYESEAAFEDVPRGLKLAIEGRGMYAGQ